MATKIKHTGILHIALLIRPLDSSQPGQRPGPEKKNPIISKSPELKQILSWKKFSLKPQWSIDNLLLEIYLLLWTQLFKELNQEFLDSGLHYITLYKELQWHLLYNCITIYIIVISPIRIISTEVARIQEFRNFVNLFAISGIHLN